MEKRIKFSSMGTGACPMCVKFGDCHIIKSMELSVERQVKPKYDDRFEIVVYLCPEFEEE